MLLPALHTLLLPFPIFYDQDRASSSLGLILLLGWRHGPWPQTRPGSPLHSVRKLQLPFGAPSRSARRPTSRVWYTCRRQRSIDVPSRRERRRTKRRMFLWRAVLQTRSIYHRLPDVLHVRFLNKAVPVNDMRSRIAATAAGWSCRQSQEARRVP